MASEVKEGLQKRLEEMEAIIENTSVDDRRIAATEAYALTAAALALTVMADGDILPSRR